MLCRPAISSMSLGRAWAHGLPHKFDVAQKYGFMGIELFHEDLEHIAMELEGGDTPDNRTKAAHIIRKLCDERDITIISLQPFMHYEGLRDRTAHAKRIEEMKLWLKLANILRTNMIQIPASFLGRDQITRNMDVIVGDMIEVAEMGLREDPVINFAYESLAWSTYIDTWERCWDVVQKVNRPNFGACLDTFNIAGRVFADPASSTGKTPNADADIKVSIEHLLRTVDINKVFYIQVVDAERLDQPLVEGHPFYNPDQPARMSWSRNCRLFYGEQSRGGYLPIKEIAQAFVHGLGYEGWVSMELFNRLMADPHPEIPERLACRGAEAWLKFVKDLNLDSPRSS